MFNTFRLLGFGLGYIAAGCVVQGGPYSLGGATLPGFDAAFAFASFTALGPVLVYTQVEETVDVQSAESGGAIAQD